MSKKPDTTARSERGLEPAGSLGKSQGTHPPAGSLPPWRYLVRRIQPIALNDMLEEFLLDGWEFVQVAAGDPLVLLVLRRPR